MKEKKRIACFFTAGYTELNAMKAFMSKINRQAEYIQLCPIAQRRSKDMIRNRHVDSMDGRQSGLTGPKLIDYVLDFIKTKRFREEQYDALLIEDDKDHRFLRLLQNGTGEIDREEWERFKKGILDQIHLLYPDMPVVFFFAAPEVETWFLADWENGFGNVYSTDFSRAQNVHFSTKFRMYVNDYILTNAYRNCMESYGYFDGKYRKLSGEIQEKIAENDFLLDYKPDELHPIVSYSKRKEGERMLYQIEPELVLRNCDEFFREAFYSLKGIGVDAT